MSYPTDQASKYRAPITDLVLPTQGVPITQTTRGISPETYALYGVTMQEDGDGIIYPYRTDGHLVGEKTRLRGKRFPFEGVKESVTLFRPRAAFSGTRYLVLTEGEQDAMAAHEMTGYTAWSVPFGAASAASYVTRSLREIESHDIVYLMMDNDDEGRKAAARITELVDPTKLRVCTFPPGVKDANDVLIKWGKFDAHGAHTPSDFLRTITWGARAPVADGVLDTGKAVATASDWYFDRDKRRGIETGYPQLDELIGGWRPGDVHVLVGGTGSSKSTTSRQFLQRLAERGVPVAYVSFEDSVELSVLRFMEMTSACDLIHEDDPTLSRAEFVQLSERALANVNLADGMSMTNVSENILKLVRWYARTGVKLVVIDHLTAISDSLQLSEFNQFMRELVATAASCGTCLLAVSHMSRDNSDKKDNAPSLSRVKNSSGIAQWATGVMGVVRERDSNHVTMSMLKNSRTWGRAGEAHFSLNPETMRLESASAPLPETTEEDYNGEQW